MPDVPRQMDPLSALSAAGTIVQFVDFSSGLFKRGREFYKSSGGVLSVNREIDLVVTDIQAVVFKLRKSLNFDNAPAADESLSPTEDAEMASWRRICDGTVAIAEEILARLERLRVKNSNNRKWESVRKAVQSAWSEDEIKSLVGRLSSFKEALTLRILTLLM